MVPADAAECGRPLMKEEKIGEESDQFVQDVGNNSCQQADACRQKRLMFRSPCPLDGCDYYSCGDLSFLLGPNTLRRPSRAHPSSMCKSFVPVVTCSGHGLLRQLAFPTHYSTQRRHQLGRGFLQLLKMMQRQLR